jgi:hypothetical protein
MGEYSPLSPPLATPLVIQITIIKIVQSRLYGCARGEGPRFFEFAQGLVNRSAPLNTLWKIVLLFGKQF